MKGSCFCCLPCILHETIAGWVLQVQVAEHAFCLINYEATDNLPKFSTTFCMEVIASPDLSLCREHVLMSHS